MFRFCTEVLHLSEAAAYKRIQAARAARKWPLIIEHLRDGFITLGALGTLAPHLTDGNYKDLLEEARHRGKRDVELIVARLRPLPDVPSVIRKLPEPRKAAPARPAVIAPLSPERYRKKAAAVATPRRPCAASEGSRMTDESARTIPAHVRRAVWARDRGRCAFEGSHGRCGARGLVEYHHVIPYALGGAAIVDNIELRCRAHNAHEARLAGLDRPDEEVNCAG